MKKIAKIISVALCTTMIATGFTACTTTNVEKLNIIPDSNPYSFTNTKSHAPVDTGMTIDGVLDEARWTDENLRWLKGFDQPNTVQSADITFTTSYGEQGVYFAMIVEEHGVGTGIYVNPNRPSYVNSCIEMYLGPAEDGQDSKRTFEFDFMADGTYHSRFAYTPGDLLTHWDIAPVVASTTIGGAVNTPECYGYTVEAMFPYTYLEWAWTDYDLSDKENMVFGIDPVHVFSYNLGGNDPKKDRLWSRWSIKHTGSAWNDPSTYFKFGKNGLICYNYNVTIKEGIGSVKEQNGLNCILTDRDATFSVRGKNGQVLKSITVNGVDMTNEVVNGLLTIKSPSEDLDIEASFGF